jgi:hypothetical protein
VKFDGDIEGLDALYTMYLQYTPISECVEDTLPGGVRFMSNKRLLALTHTPINKSGSSSNYKPYAERTSILIDVHSRGNIKTNLNKSSSRTMYEYLGDPKVFSVLMTLLQKKINCLHANSEQEPINDDTHINTIDTEDVVDAVDVLTNHIHYSPTTSPPHSPTTSPTTSPSSPLPPPHSPTTSPHSPTTSTHCPKINKSQPIAVSAHIRGAISTSDLVQVLEDAIQFIKHNDGGNDEEEDTMLHGPYVTIYNQAKDLLK